MRQNAGGDINSRRLTLPILAMIGNILLSNNIFPLLRRIIAKIIYKIILFHQHFISYIAECGAARTLGCNESIVIR